MKFLLFLILIFTSVATFAQNHTIGIVAGASRMNVSASEDYLNSTKARDGFTIGISYENRIKKHFLVGADLMYYERGFQSSVPLTFKSEMEPLLSGNYSYDYNYLAMPIKCGYVTGNKISAFFNVGLIPAYMTDAKLYLPESNHVEFALKSSSSSLHTYSENISRFDMAGLLEIGANIKITSRFLISAAASYQHSFTAISSPDYYDDVEIKSFGFLLTGGIKYVL